MNIKNPVLIITFNLLLGLTWLIFKPQPLQAQGPAEVVLKDLWSTNGPVYYILPHEDTIYLAGDFTQVRQNIGSGVPLSIATGSPIAGFPRVNGEVKSVVADGRGGWYIGGDFTDVAGLERNYIAHILPDYSVNPIWKPNANDVVYTLAISGNLVYVGGDFTIIGSQNRNKIAALDTVAGNATAWNPNANDRVNTLAIKDNAVYAGGRFNEIGGQTRNKIAAVNAATGNATAWNPDANNQVQALAIKDNTVYAGGYFTAIGGQPRDRIAAISVTTGNATAWNPDSDDVVQTFAISGNTIYVGGDFANIGGQSRDNIAALDVTTGNATAWNPDANDAITALVINNNLIYVGGQFTNIGGENRNYIAALNITSSDATVWTPTTWNPNVNQAVNTLATNGNTIYAGGIFSTMGGQSRNNIAALNATTGQVTDWNPNSTGPVNALVVSGTTLYAGGDFRMIGGQSRARLAALDRTTGQVIDWDPGADRYVLTMAISGNIIYAGGDFDTIGGQSRNHLAALNATTGQVTAWNPNADNNIQKMVITDNVIYAAGRFTTIGGQSRGRLAKLDPVTGQLYNWNPNANDLTYSLKVDGDTAYIGGFFTEVGGQIRNHIAAVNTTTGEVTAWNPNAQGGGGDGTNVFALAIQDNIVYASGRFTTIGGQSRNHIAALDASTGNAIAWNPNANNRVRTIAIGDDILYAGGEFTNINGQEYSHIAAIRLAPTILLLGNGQEISNGSISPSPANHTDFGTTAVNGGLITRTFTLKNSSGKDVTLTGSPPISLTTGTHFRVTAQPNSSFIPIGSSATFQVTFAPSIVGSFQDTVYIANDSDNDHPFTFAISGISLPLVGLASSNNSPTALGQPTTFAATIEAGTNVTYVWNFGDGTDASGANVSHTYSAVGNYTAVVTASNSFGSQTTTTDVTIVDVPIAGLIASNNSPTLLGKPTTLAAATSTGTNVSYSWNFGDGNSANGANVNHIYGTIGVHTAMVTATNSFGNQTTTTTITIVDSAIYLPLVVK